MKTPHLDRLAHEGTDFDPFNVLNPVGSPSRAAAITGTFGVAQNTIVIFSSDNGPATTAPKSPQSSRDHDAGVARYGGYSRIGASGGLRGEKRRLFEGGVRVPFLVRWPGHTPAGVINPATDLTAVDLLPTLGAAAGVTLPTEYRGDGQNLTATLNGDSVRRTRPIFWAWTGKAARPDGWPRLTVRVRDGEGKLALTTNGKRPELDRLTSDRAEAVEVAKDRLEIVARLTQLALAWHAPPPATVDPAGISSADRTAAPTTPPGTRRIGTFPPKKPT